MSSALAIVSKAVFEKQAQGAAVGAVLALDHYDSLHVTLDGLAEGGALFLVTVRPPKEALWLVAVLEAPKRGKSGWMAAPNRVPIADISGLKKKLKFTSGTGIQAKAGALGMSLQTPRGLTDADVALLRAATGKPAKDSRVVAPVKVAIKKKSKASAAEVPVKSAPDPDSGAHLAALQAAFAAKDGPAALTAALAWWRVARAPVLADLIDAISKQISGPPVTSEFEITRLAAAKNPLDLGRILPAARDVQVNYLPTLAEFLVAYPADPRISMAFTTWLDPPITTSISKQSFWSQLFKLVQRDGDVRIVPKLKKRLAKKPYSSGWWDTFCNHLERTIAKLDLVPSVVDGKALAKLAVGKLSVPASKIAAAPAAPKLSGALLAQAATHLAAGRADAAIAAMVERWRETRVPALADLIDRANRLSPSYDRPLVSHGGGGAAAWLAAFEADPAAHLPQLLANLGIGGHRNREMHMSMIAGLPDDPRIAMSLAMLCNMTGGGRNDGQFWKLLFETLARHRDARTFAFVREMFDDFDDTYFYAARPAKRYMSKLTRTPEKFFDTWPLALDAADQKLFDKLATQVDTAVTKAEARERALVAAIAEDWKSDGPREVYADFLMEREHPRGELIMLETKRTRSAEETERLGELENLWGLFGALGRFFTTDGSKRERGLYREVSLPWNANTLTWRAAATSPLAALIETIDLDDSEDVSAEDFAAFVAAAPSLRKIKGMTKAGIESLDPAKQWKHAGSGNSQYVVRT